MFHVYRKDGSWLVKGYDTVNLDRESAINYAAQIGAKMQLDEFQVYVEEEPEVYVLSPYEEILGFQICNRCGLHPCEC